MDKIRPGIVAEVALRFALQGVALGAIYPELLRAVFERTQAPMPHWQLAHASGLDIGPEQPQWSYEEAEEAENKDFMAYCQEIRPNLYSVLKD